MLASLLLAAVTGLPLGAWPADSGPAVTVVDEVEFFVQEPEDEYWIIAVAPLSPPIARTETAGARRLSTLARRLGADGVLLLAEVNEKSVPNDPQAPLPTTERYSVAVFVSFGQGERGEGTQPPTATSKSHLLQRHRRPPRLQKLLVRQPY